MADAWLGRIVSHYEITERLGEGGMGVVYKARDTRLDRFVAIKVLPPEKIADPERKLRFAQEAKAASALNHPGIVTIHDIASEDGVDFIVMEFVPGKTLDQRVQRHGLRLGEVLKYSVQIADALAAAHAAGIIHRDLKPGNVMVTEKDQVKVLDFGLAKLTEAADPDEGATRTLRLAADPLTEEGAVLGTVAYMSPEQAEARKLDARSDIFSFGGLLYEMITGRRAFYGDSRMSTLTAILRDEPKPLSDAGNAVPRDLEKIIARCLRKDPARRFQHMDDVKVALEELKEETDSGRLSEPVRVAPRRTSWFVYAGFAVMLALTVATGFWWLSRESSSSRTAGLTLRQLTQDTGTTDSPGLSPDGRLVAYASDRDGGPAIWVQQLAPGSQAIRLAAGSSPSFSPDGGQIVFARWGGRLGGDVYIIPSLGGEQRLLLRGVWLRPRFSPDSRWVAAAGGPSDMQRTGLAVVLSSGGSPRRLAEDFYSASRPVWSPDGAKLLFLGRRQQSDPMDWWVVPLEGGPPAQTGAAAVLPKTSSGDTPEPAEWIEDRILFSTGNLWRIALSSRDYKLGQPERLTTGAASEEEPRAISGPKGWRFVFSSGQTAASLWRFPIDHLTGKVLGAPEKLFRDGVPRTTASLPTGGSRLVYVFRGPDGYGVRARDTKTGAEITLVQSPTDMRARISPDGSTVAYNLSINEAETVIYLIPATGGEARQLCNRCGLIYDWSPDGKRILYRSGNPTRFSVIEVTTGTQAVILAHPKHGVYSAVYSPDQRWIAFHFGATGPVGIFIAPVAEDGAAKPESEWIPIVDRSASRAWWSPDGNVLYFVSTAPGKLAILARRLDRSTKRPASEAFAVFVPPGEQSLRSGHWFGPALSSNQLVIPIYESSSNVWLAE